MSRTVLLTRFNLPSEGVEGLIRAREGWLQERIELFATYTVPSVRHQTIRPRWVVYVDPESPSWLTERLALLAGVDEVFDSVRHPAPTRADLVADVRRVLGRADGPVITANLDNDDALAVDFVERLQGVVPDGRRAIYHRHGLITTTTACYVITDPLNAFCAVQEDLADPVTCWVDWHNRLPLTMPVTRLGGAPGWLQVVHSANVSNRVRGRLVSPEGHRRQFPGLLEEVPHPTARRRAVDLLVDSPARVVREAGRRGARRAFVALMGKERFDRVKHALAQRTTAS